MAEHGKKMMYLPKKSELKLLEVLLDPNNRYKQVLEVCRIAKISKDTFYAAFKKDEFKALYTEESLAIIRRNVAPLVNALVKEAKRGSAQHLKMALEMAGVYTEKHEVVTETYAERIKRLREQHKR